jgi:hypothetical protein
VLIPARNEADNIRSALTSVCAQTDVPHLKIFVLDDASTDATATIAEECAQADSRVSVVRSDGEPPEGWLGKPWACQRLSELPGVRDADILVFIDADVNLAPHAVAAAVELMRAASLDVVCPYPRQVTVTGLQKLVQPLLQWSWAATLPLRVAERATQPSLTAANGQFLVVDAAAYRRCGGHSSVAEEVLEDIALMRSLKATGARGGVVDGTNFATCRMYTDNASMIAGYTKSLWAAFSSAAAAAVVAAALLVLFVAPVVAALACTVVGAWLPATLWGGAYAAAVASRFAVAMRTAGPRASAVAHPLSIVIFVWLLMRSWRAKRAGALIWKGRVLS